MKSFKTPKKNVGTLDAETAARLISVSSDIALILDKKGVIRDISFDDDKLQAEGCAGWVGKPWVETVTIESREKIHDLLHEATAEPYRWRQVNHSTTRGADLPVRYTAMQIGDDGRIVAVGRDLRTLAAMQQRVVEAQFQVEKEYTKVRSLEARYRSLFQMSSEPVVIIDGSSLRIIEANPAAIGLLANGTRRVVNRHFIDLFEQNSIQAVQAMLAGARSVPKVDDIAVRLKEGSQYTLSASVFRADGATHILARFAPIHVEHAKGMPAAASNVLKVISSLPDGFLVVDADLRILLANGTFLEYAQLASEEQAKGARVDQWLGRIGVDTEILFANLREHGSVRRFNTVLRSAFGAMDVEVSGVSVPASDPPCFGLTLRKVEREPQRPAGLSGSLPRSVDQLTELVGRVPLKDLVRETTDIIERMCIEAALRLTGDNRASAAEILGLSRQGLYMKLRRYGLGDLDESAP